MQIRTDIKAGSLTVYGLDDCSWTRKQLEYLDGKGMQYKYINCKGGECPGFVNGYPTLDKDGQILVGFQKI